MSSPPNPDEVRQFGGYVALGSSTPSGLGIAPHVISPTTPPGCGRSANSYPALLSRSIGVASFTDASCSGATADNLYSSQVRGGFLSADPAPPQLAALRQDTKMVSLTVGSNDINLLRLFGTDCPRLAARAWDKSPCKDSAATLPNAKGIDERVSSVRKSLTQALSIIHHKSPYARVLLIGYGQYAPATQSPDHPCRTRLRLADGDVAWFHDLTERLDAAMRAAAQAPDNAKFTTFVDSFGHWTGHDACADDAHSWTNGSHAKPGDGAGLHPRQSGAVAMGYLAKCAMANRPVTQQELERVVDETRPTSPNQELRLPACPSA
ncbi:SGNH/GDSL hydrolase family protein [Solihabitans fulvus]|uniref:SGNH/GDSL hydrolase family protein n=1 Tax=Solihabitans fulvus TaxID=1892852 RepID=UPI001661E4B7|nr:SGNH/GDSL hydrolase family protein [Solihabitans fulvus]